MGAGVTSGVVKSESFEVVVDGIVANVTTDWVDCVIVFRGSFGAIIKSGSRPVKGFLLFVWIA